MKERGSGVIVNIVGMAGKLSTPGYIAGAAGNASLIQFSISLGEESFRHGVRVLCINPSPTLTERLVTLRRARAETLFGDPERWRGSARQRKARPGGETGGGGEPRGLLRLRRRVLRLGHLHRHGIGAAIPAAVPPEPDALYPPGGGAQILS